MGLFRTLAPFAIAVVVLAPIATDAQTYRRPRRDASAPGVPVNVADCVKVHGVARYRVGYTHVVELENTCAGPVHCDVATNVDPTPTQPIDLARGEKREIVTRMGATAYEFEPVVICRTR